MEEPNLCRTQRRESRSSGLDRVRQAQRLDATSEVRTVCVSSASTGPCGGCRVTGIPTATRLGTHAETCARTQWVTRGQVV